MAVSARAQRARDALLPLLITRLEMPSCYFLLSDLAHELAQFRNHLIAEHNILDGLAQLLP